MEGSRTVRSMGRAVRAPRPNAPGRTPHVHEGLVARGRELAEIEHLLRRVRRGRSGAIAFHGECGVGKSALIEAAVARAADFRMVQVRGAAGTAEVHDLVSTWPEALHELVARVGVAAADPPRFLAEGGPPSAMVPPALVDTAASSLRGLTGAGPVLVAVDDGHALPRSLVVAIAAAIVDRLRDEPLGLVVAWQDTPHLEPFHLGVEDVHIHQLGGLTVPQSRELLAVHSDQLPEETVLAELVGRTGGNPLALLDSCSRLNAAQLAGWHPLPDPLPLGPNAVEAFDVVRHLPPATRRALVVVAAGTASTEAMAQAMDRLDVSMRDLAPALETGIVYRLGPRIDFGNPLVRSAAFHRAPPELRAQVRRALSDALADVRAVEASAYHASIGVTGVDELAARRLAEAANVALNRGDPVAAARDEELAAGCAASPDHAAQYFADAAGHWAASGELERARHCVEAGAELGAGAGVMAEIAYQRARLERGADGATVPEQIVAAADACASERPSRALAMQLDAAAWWLFADEPAAAERVAERAVRSAGTVSSHFELLARMVHAATVLASGRPVDRAAERSLASLVIGETERFPGSPEVAFVIGRSLLQQGLRRQGERWSQWISRCARRTGDVVLAAVPPLLDCAVALFDADLATAAQALEETSGLPGASGSIAMSAWAWQLAASVHTMAGNYEQGIDAAVRLFSIPDGVARAARLRAFPALALLELQRRHPDAAMAWARIGKGDVCTAGETGRLSPVAFAVVAPLMASVSLLAGCPTGDRRCDALAAEDAPLAAVPEWSRNWLEGSCGTEDPVDAVALLDAARSALDDRPLLQMLADLCSAVQLHEAGRVEDAADRLALIEQRTQRSGAAGLARIAAFERERLLGVPTRSAPSSGDARATLAPRPDQHVPAGDMSRSDAAAPPEWEISLLGSFSVRRRGKPLALPASLATQAIKIVALQPRITVDEMIELLWEEAEPSVGARRLRNVLWRIRSLCGELIVREDGFLRLARGATTDLQRFRVLAEQALVGPEAGAAGAVERARAALDCYRGELLPGDRYADWSVAARESATRTHLRLLDLLVDDALAEDRQGEALVLLDRLSDIDPYDERHHLRTAQIHLDAGNRGRAFDALEHAERMLADLGVAPSSAVRRMRAELNRR